MYSHCCISSGNNINKQYTCILVLTTHIYIYIFSGFHVVIVKREKEEKRKNIISLQSIEVQEKKSEMINNIKKMETTLATVDDEEGSGV